MVTSTLLPVEIWIKILLKCDAPDILTIGHTCTYFRNLVHFDPDSTHLWRLKWVQLLSKCKLDFVKLYEGSINYKEASIRLHYLQKLSNVEFFRCNECAGFTCTSLCAENKGARVVIDIGNKYTVIVNPNLTIHKHFTLYGICRKKETRLVYRIEMKGISTSKKLHKKSSHYSFLTILHGLQLHHCTCDQHARHSYCKLCNPLKMYPEEKEKISDGTLCNISNYMGLQNEFCKDAEQMVDFPDKVFVSPAAVLLQSEQFSIVRNFITEILHSMELLSSLQKPNAILMFCEPLDMNKTSRYLLLNYLFLMLKVSRVCLLPKPLAICAMLELETCIVIDSGALCTSVAVIENGQVVPQRWKNIPVGGWHIAKNLKEAKQWDSDNFTNIPVSLLDSINVKEKCRLSYNINAEQRRKGEARKELIHLPVTGCKNLNSLDVTFGAELFLAPEVMYTHLNLPQVICELIKGMPEPTIRECLRHIVLAGGNTDLIGLRVRIARDLSELLPEYSTIFVKGSPGCNSYNVAVGSTYITLPRPNCTPFNRDEPKRIPGLPFWITREQYLLYGCGKIDEDDFLVPDTMRHVP
ncbi:hypothetical protein L9F63_010010 [Diploptera punctata]|uniref:F-box domain-containing protein n=1 Tax=Diploptera punctata TaxID=6984 RepID=A0AAD8AHZ3_DIPPU|nr:hypothetical protein L9F63_010010 [Diploptera punctata]